MLLTLKLEAVTSGVTLDRVIRLYIRRGGGNETDVNFSWEKWKLRNSTIFRKKSKDKTRQAKKRKKRKEKKRGEKKRKKETKWNVKKRQEKKRSEHESCCFHGFCFLRAVKTRVFFLGIASCAVLFYVHSGCRILAFFPFWGFRGSFLFCL